MALTLIFTDWSSSFLEVSIDFSIVAHFKDKVDIVCIFKVVIKLKNRKETSSDLHCTSFYHKNCNF